MILTYLRWSDHEDGRRLQALFILALRRLGCGNLWRTFRERSGLVVLRFPFVS